VRGVNDILIALALAASILFVVSCSSPLELDVDRTMTYTDGVVSPFRATLLYYFGDSAYEAIYSDLRLLQSIKIDTMKHPSRITIQQLNSPRFATAPSAQYPVMIQAFGFGLHDQPADEVVRDIVNGFTFLNVDLLQTDNTTSRNYLWFIDGVTRRLRVGFIQEPLKRIVKGRILIQITDPYRDNKTVTTYGLLTLDY